MCVHDHIPAGLIAIFISNSIGMPNEFPKPLQGHAKTLAISNAKFGMPFWS